VVAKGKARIRRTNFCRTERHHLDKAINAFTEVGKELGVLNNLIMKIIFQNSSKTE